MSKLGRTLCLFCLLVIVILLGEILIKTHNNNLPRQAYVNDSFSLENDFYPNYEAFQVAAQALWKNKAIFYQDGQKHPIIIGNSDAETIYKQNHLEKSISLDDWNTVIILDEIKKIYEISFVPALWDGGIYSLPYLEFVYVVDKEHVYESHIIYYFQIDQPDENTIKALNKSFDYICKNKDYAMSFTQIEQNNWYYLYYISK